MAVSAATKTHSGAAPAKAAHVNMMTDTVIANMPAEGLRSIMRGLLGGNAQITSAFTNLAAIYLENTRPGTIPALFDGSSGSPKPKPALQDMQCRYRCLMGCGYGFESMSLLSSILRQIQLLEWDPNTLEGQDFMDVLAIIDGDTIQAVTAVQKKLLTSTGLRPMSYADLQTVSELKSALDACKQNAISRGQEYAFERGLYALEKLSNSTATKISSKPPMPAMASNGFVSSDSALETVRLGPVEVPRMFMGLWQFSSPAWGTASKSKINRHFRQHVDAGLIAYGSSSFSFSIFITISEGIFQTLS
jgi:hypothetical protein